MLAAKAHTPEIIIKRSSLPKARLPAGKATILRSKTSLVVSKNVAKKAVDRNRIKRIIKEAQRKLNLPASNYTLIVNKNIASLKTYQVQEILSKLLGKR